MLVGQGNAQAVDLEFGDVVERRLRREVERPADPGVELAQFIGRVGVVEAEHRRHVAHRVEALGGPAADALRRRRRVDELGVLVLDRAQLAHERVEFGVADLGIVVNVIALFVMSDARPQVGDALGGAHRSRLST